MRQIGAHRKEVVMMSNLNTLSLCAPIAVKRALGTFLSTRTLKWVENVSGSTAIEYAIMASALGGAIAGAGLLVGEAVAAELQIVRSTLCDALSTMCMVK